jgi:hypothetical protein
VDATEYNYTGIKKTPRKRKIKIGTGIKKTAVRNTIKKAYR